MVVLACLGNRAALVTPLLNYVPWCYLAGNYDLISQRDNKERNANSNALARLVIYKGLIQDNGADIR